MSDHEVSKAETLGAIIGATFVPKSVPPSTQDSPKDSPRTCGTFEKHRLSTSASCVYITGKAGRAAEFVVSAVISRREIACDGHVIASPGRTSREQKQRAA